MNHLKYRLGVAVGNSWKRDLSLMEEDCSHHCLCEGTFGNPLETPLTGNLPNPQDAVVRFYLCQPDTTFLSIPLLLPHCLRKNLRGSKAARCGQKKKGTEPRLGGEDRGSASRPRGWRPRSEAAPAPQREMLSF